MLALLFAAGLGTASAQQTELEVAYQREFAYLQAEKKTLEDRLDSLSAESKRRVRSAEEELSSLQNQLLGLRSRVSGQEELLSAALRDSDQISAAQDLVDATLFQANSTLEAEVPTPETPEAQAEALVDAFSRGADAVQAGARVSKEEGSYFLMDGTKVEGTIVRVGRVAAYGVGPRSGALLPVGDGKLALRDTEAADVASALASGGTPDPVGIFVYEDTGKRVEEAEPKTFFTIMESGGIIGWVIVALGAVGLVLGALRAYFIGTATRGGEEVEQSLAQLAQDDWSGAEQTARAAPGAASRVLEAMLPLGPQDLKRLEDRASEAILMQTPRIERFGTAIIVIAAVAPLLGLLGTVTGMIGTFEIITTHGTGDPAMLAGGISVALVTTQLGLVVAIPMLLIGNLLNQGAERALSSLETAALAVINRAEPPPADDEPTAAIGASTNAD